MGERFRENDIGSENPQDWVENEEGVLEFKKEVEKPKRKTGASKLVGFSPVEENWVMKEVEELFNNQSSKEVFEHDIALFEREKTEEEIETINGILSKMPEFLQKYEGDFPPVTAEHLHILDTNKFPEEVKKQIEKDPEGGGYVVNRQFAYIFDEGDALKNAQKIVHELVHFGAFQSFERKKDGKGASIRRSGFSVHNNEKDNKEVYFVGINEAITEELTKRFYQEYFKAIPQLEKEAEGQKEYVGAYQETRRRFWQDVKQIYGKNKDQFDSEEDVFTVFAKAAMTGKLLETARLTEGAYGKGALRKAAEKTKK